MKTLFFCVESPLMQRDYERFGIEYLSSFFNVIVVDCTMWLKPYTMDHYAGLIYLFQGYRAASTFSQAREILKDHQGAVVVDYLGEGRKSERLRRFIQNQGLLLAQIPPGLLPPRYGEKLSFLQRVRKYIFQPQCWVTIGRRLLKKISFNKSSIAYIAVLTAEAALDYPKFCAAK